MSAEPKPKTKEIIIQSTFDPKKQNQVAKLVRLAKEAAIEFFLDETKDVYAWIPIVHGERGGKAVRIQSAEFSNLIRLSYFKENNSGFSEQSLKSALGIIEAETRQDPKRVHLHVRYAFIDNQIFVDTGEYDWSVWKISKEGVTRTRQEFPIFKRFDHMKELYQVDLSGTIQDVRSYISSFNLKDPADSVLVAGFIGASMIESIPHAILLTIGPQGSSKTTFNSSLKRLIDPSKLEAISLSHDPEEMVQALSHHYFAVFDNVNSRLTKVQEDILSKCATGENFSKRAHYTNDDDFIYSFKHVSALNGINPASGAADFLDRGFMIRLERISKKKRLTEDDVRKFVDGIGPKALGATFNALSKATQVFEEVKKEMVEKPRMADFAVLAEAFCRALGFEKNQFINRYMEKIEEASSEALEAEPVASLLVKIVDMKNDHVVKGTATDLLHLVRKFDHFEEDDDFKYDIPKTPSHLSRAIRSMQSTLKDLGYEIDHRRTDRGSWITIWKAKKDKANRISPDEDSYKEDFVATEYSDVVAEETETSVNVLKDTDHPQDAVSELQQSPLDVSEKTDANDGNDAKIETF